jgi:hypothetical protein
LQRSKSAPLRSRRNGRPGRKCPRCLCICGLVARVRLQVSLRTSHKLPVAKRQTLSPVAHAKRCSRSLVIHLSPHAIARSLQVISNRSMPHSKKCPQQY